MRNWIGGAGHRLVAVALRAGRNDESMALRAFGSGLK